MCRYDPGHGVLHFARHLRDGDEFIGYGMIAKIDAYNRSCLVGITIGERALWGQGLAHEALTAVIEFCFTALEMNRIGAEVFAFNTRSLRLLDGLGFRREGVRREAVLKKSRYEDEVIYGLLRREWEPTSSAPGRYVH